MQHFTVLRVASYSHELEIPQSNFFEVSIQRNSRATTSTPVNGLTSEALDGSAAVGQKMSLT